MPRGPGKYDELCTFIREYVGILDGRAGGVIVIVLGGNQGTGFACQSDIETAQNLPDMLEDIAGQIRESLLESEP